MSTHADFVRDVNRRTVADLARLHLGSARMYRSWGPDHRREAANALACAEHMTRLLLADRGRP